MISHGCDDSGEQRETKIRKSEVTADRRKWPFLPRRIFLKLFLFLCHVSAISLTITKREIKIYHKTQQYFCYKDAFWLS